MLPTTPQELENAFHNYNVTGPVNGDIAEYSGKFVWRYNSRRLKPFILVTYKEADFIDEVIKFENFEKELTSLKGQDKIDRYIFLNAENEKFGYQFVHSMKVNAPNYSWVEDHENKEYHLALELIKGDKPSKRKHSNTSVWQSLYHTIPVMTGISNFDLKQSNIFICNNTPINFDYGDSLQNSQYWSSKINESQEGALELLMRFQKNEEDRIPGATPILKNIISEKALIGFMTAIQDLENDKNAYTTPKGEELFINVKSRLSHCADYIKAKL